MSLADRLFGVSLCALCVILTLNSNFYLFLYATTLAGVLVLWTRKTQILEQRFYTLALPCTFIALVAVTPNNPFTDLPVATVMAASFVCGLAAAYCTEQVVRTAAILIGASLSVQACYAVVTGFPQTLMWNGRLSLLFDHPAVLAHVASWPALYLLCQEQSKSRLFLGITLIILCICLGVVAMTTSRGVFVGLLFSAIFLLCTRFRAHVRAVTVAGILFFATAFIIAPDEHRDRLISGIKNPFSDANFVSRMAIWEPAVDGFQQAPFFGLGIRHFKGYHQSYINTHQVDMEDRYPNSPLKKGLRSQRELATGKTRPDGVSFSAGLAKPPFR